MITIYHNPRCSKSRETLHLLQEAGCEITERLYLKKIPTKKELKDVLMKLGLKAVDLVRTNEAVYKKQFANKKFNNEEWLQILIEYPTLIQRPIVVDGYKAIIARPSELALELVKRKTKKTDPLGWTGSSKI